MTEGSGDQLESKQLPIEKEITTIKLIPPKDFVEVSFNPDGRLVVEHSGKKFDVASPFNQDGPTEDCSDEIKLLVESSEQVNNRRQTMNNFFWAINSAVISGYIALLTFALSQSSKLQIVGCVAFMVLSWIGFLFCVRWIATIENYGKVSRSKIAILQGLESIQKWRVYSCQYEVLDKFGYESQTKLEKGHADLFSDIHVSAFFIGSLIFLYLCVMAS